MDYVCLNCNKKWSPRLENPKRCPDCNSVRIFPKDKQKVKGHIKVIDREQPKSEPNPKPNRTYTCGQCGGNLRYGDMICQKCKSEGFTWD